MSDLPTIQALIEAHRTALALYEALPGGDVPDDVAAELMRTGEELCSYRPATLDGVHLKAAYMMSCFVFVGGEDGDPDFTHMQLVSGFLPAEG